MLNLQVFTSQPSSTGNEMDAIIIFPGTQPSSEMQLFHAKLCVYEMTGEENIATSGFWTSLFRAVPTKEASAT